MLGKTPWNKGLTKETCPITAKASKKIAETYQEKMETGWKSPAWTDQIWTPEKRKAHSEWRKELHRQRPDLHPNRRLAGNRAKMTYPEQLAYDCLLKLGVEFQHQFQIDRFFVDFCVGKIVIEIDGKRWHPEGNDRDKQRDLMLKALGYEVHRISASSKISTEIMRILGK